MTVDRYTCTPDSFPPLLREIPDPPEQLHVRGTLPDPDTYRFLAVVGSRKHTEYGQRVVEHLISELRDCPVCVISGLALGIDALAHTAALDAGLPTIAVPGSGLGSDVLYPKSNRGLAERILKSGGALISEYEDDFKAEPWSFPQRNRIMAGMSHGTLIIEAEEKSGTLITARLAMEYNREVLVVPGSLFSPTAGGTHYLLKNGATPIRSAEDIIEALGLAAKQTTLFETLSRDEQKLLKLLDAPQTKETLRNTLNLSHYALEGLITSLISKGVVRERMGVIERIN